MKRKAVIPVHVWFSVKLFFLFLTFLCGGKKVQPYEYPSFLQCDKRWGADIMNGSISICESGCAMTSLAMYFQGSGIDVPPHQTLDPRSFNAWLRKNEGYVCDRKYKKFCADLNLPKMKYLDKKIIYNGEKNPPGQNSMIEALMNQSGLLLHVRNKTHFVLLTGYDDENADIFYVNDPASFSTTYLYADVSDIIMYQIDSH
jgi:hypothetical protein